MYTRETASKRGADPVSPWACTLMMDTNDHNTLEQDYDGKGSACCLMTEKADQEGLLRGHVTKAEARDR